MTTSCRHSVSGLHRHRISRTLQYLHVAASVERFRIHDVDGLAVLEGKHARELLTKVPIELIALDITEVWRAHHVVHLQKRVLIRNRLLPVDIYRSRAGSTGA